MKNKKLNIYNSDFSIRADLKNNEKIIQKNWEKIDLINLIKKNPLKKIIFLSGPPYANGNIHLGHALNKILKDFTLRFFALKGHSVEYKPGWDVHGLPIATAVHKLNFEGKPKKNNLIFRKICNEYALKQIEIQINQFKKLGLLVDFNQKYITGDFNYIAHQLKIFSKLVDQKRIQRSLKPVFWSWSSQTALADTEIFYQEKITKSLFFLFPLINCSNNLNLKNSFLVAWTTSIWTIPENKLLAIDQNQKYFQLNLENKKIIVSENIFRKSSFFKNLTIEQSFMGSSLIGCQYKHSYLNFSSKIVHSDHVKSTDGTGIVHIAPAYGLDDYNLAKNNNINIKVAIDEKGFFNKESKDKELINIFLKKAEEIILKKIKLKKNYLKIEEIKHSVPFDWRTNKFVFYRATPQWYFVNLPKDSKIINDWEPSWGQKKIQKNLSKRNEWCISRQRVWGVPIPAFYDKNQKIVLKSELIEIVIKKILEKKTDQIWWSLNLNTLIPKKLIEKYKLVEKSFETMDVWFDSGCAAEFNYFSKNEKIDFIWEGNDQFRGWFSSLSIISSEDKIGFIKKALVHGFVNDEKGLKMSKSKNNTQDPNDICKNFGADILRLWVINSNYFDDINFGQKILQETLQIYLKTRNTVRFLINNLIDYDPQKNFQKELTDIDLIILDEFDYLINYFSENFNNQKFHKAWTKFFEFLNIELSNFYFNSSKLILYTEKQNNLRRRQIQTVFQIILKKINIMLAPIIPHTAEEIYSYLKFSKNEEKKISVHLEKWPTSNSNFFDNSSTKKEYLKKYKNFLFLLKEEFSKILDLKIKNKEFESSHQLEISFCLNQKKFNFLKIDKLFLTKFLKVNLIKEITFTETKELIFFTKFKKNNGILCSRCFDLVSIENKNFCSKCEEILI